MSLVRMLTRALTTVQSNTHTKMANKEADNSLYPIAVLIDELRNDDVNVSMCDVPWCLYEDAYARCAFADEPWFWAFGFQSRRC